MDDMPLDERDARHLRRAIELSAQAAERGNRPFGAVVVGAGGELLGEGVNAVFETGDCTGHAETNALRVATRGRSRDELAGATMYASGEPCVMCAGAIFWGNLRRVVFGAEAARLRAFRRLQVGGQDIEMSCRDVFAAAPHPIEVIGPALSPEALLPHERYWGSQPAAGGSGASDAGAAGGSDYSL